MKILWCGPFFSDAALNEKKSPNQASAKWSRGFLKGLANNGHEIRVIDHCPEQRWPAGHVFWQNNDPKWFLDWFPCERVSYCNAVGIKEHWLDWQYARKVRKICREWKPDVILCYNSLHSFNVAAMREAKKLGVKCVPIILDGDDPRRDNWGWLKRGNRYADGVVFLSYWMTQNYPDQSLPILHMDGGSDAWRGSLQPFTPSPLHPFALVHTGALDQWRGLNFMKRVIKCCTRQDVRFVFCGKCDKDAMWAAFDNDPRVEVKGFLPNEEVDAICRGADVFLNVREPDVGDNILNYPSKVPNYLSYGKPVVSTWIDSFSPDYRDVLEVCDNTPEGFVNVLNGVLAWNAAQREAKFNQIKSWFEERKSWNKQARRLIHWLESEVLK